MEKKFIVKTRGYEETFGNQEAAKKQYDLLKKRSVKSKEGTKIELSETDESGNKKVLESVNIGSGFFD